MLNQFIVLKKPMRPLLTSFHPPLRSFCHSPSIVHLRGIRSSGLFHPLRVALPKPINSIKTTTSSSQLKDNDKEDSDPDDEDEPIGTSGRLAEKCICHKREDDSVVYLTCEMPGLDEEDVFIVMSEKNMLVVDVKRKKRQETCDEDGDGDDDDVDDEGWKYCSNMKFELELFKINEIKAEMKNGLLKVVLPKLKGKERKDRIHVSKVNTVWSFLLFCGRIVFWFIPWEIVKFVSFMLSLVFTGIMCFLLYLLLLIYLMWNQAWDRT